MVREFFRNDVVANKVLVWPENFDLDIPDRIHFSGHLGLERLPTVRDLKFRDTFEDPSLPPPLERFSTLLPSAVYTVGLVSMRLGA